MKKTNTKLKFKVGDTVEFKNTGKKYKVLKTKFDPEINQQRILTKDIIKRKNVKSLIMYAWELSQYYKKVI